MPRTAHTDEVVEKRIAAVYIYHHTQATAIAPSGHTFTINKGRHQRQAQARQSLLPHLSRMANGKCSPENVTNCPAFFITLVRYLTFVLSTVTSQYGSMVPIM